MAGAGLNFKPDVVVYMGQAAQGMPQNEQMDQRIAEGFLGTVAANQQEREGTDG